MWTVGDRRREDVELTGHRPRRHAVDSLHHGDINDVDAADRRASLGRRLVTFPGSPQRRGHGAVGCGDGESAEWQQLARIVDRVFFWLFMATSVALLTALYVSID